MKSVWQKSLVWIAASALLGSAATAEASGSRRQQPAPSAPEAAQPEEKTSPAGLFPEFNRPEDRAAVETWCREFSSGISRYKWKIEPCRGIEWKVGGYSVRGRPLLYAEFGDPAAPNTTLILSGVHGDEITPQYIGVQLAHWLRDRQAELGKIRVVVAPLVNPDGFFRQPRTRVNARGVDVNRNFATKDWGTKALVAWKKHYRSDPRRFPGSKPASEPETLFQEELIRRVGPQKILSVHAPLNFMDYDGPTALSLERFPKEYVNECLKLRARLKAVSGGFFPGSLGNFAGRELGIPTLTLELPSADPAKAEPYWGKFSQGIRTMIEFVVPNFSSRAPHAPRAVMAERVNG